MLYNSYEQVIQRDRPFYWWRAHPGSLKSQGAPGAPGATIKNYQSGNTAPYFGGGLPGAANGSSTHTIGNSNAINGQGWITGFGVDPGTPATTGWTYECWVQLTVQPTASRIYNVFTRDSVSLLSSWGFRARDYNILFNLTNTTDVFVASNVLGRNRWTHCVGIARDGASQLWVNGQRYTAVDAGDPNGVNPASGGVSTRFSVGYSRIPTSSYYSWPGYIAEPAFYNYVLSPSQIQDHYQAGLSPCRHTARLMSVAGMPFDTAPPPPPPPGGLTVINTPLVNRRVAVVSDRPR